MVSKIAYYNVIICRGEILLYKILGIGTQALVGKGFLENTNRKKDSKIDVRSVGYCATISLKTKNTKLKNNF